MQMQMQWMKPARWMPLSIGLLMACDPPEEREATSPSSAAAGTERALPITPPGTRPSPAPREPAVAPSAASLGIAVTEIRDRGDIVEIELALDRRVRPTDANRPSLQIGDEVVRASRHPDGALDRLVFLVPRAQFDRMADGAVIAVRALGMSSESMGKPPILDKTKVVAP
jgi:hypothetical protein